MELDDPSRGGMSEQARQPEPFDLLPGARGFRNGAHQGHELDLDALLAVEGAEAHAITPRAELVQKLIVAKHESWVNPTPPSHAPAGRGRSAVTRCPRSYRNRIAATRFSWKSSLILAVEFDAAGAISRSRPGIRSQVSSARSWFRST